MLRSLYSGISGLNGNQLAMDVASNNIANVSTVGYKSQRATFKESMSQMLQGATRPPGDYGGTNPMQVGMGMGIGSIDSIMTQGALQSTGQVTDLAMQGRAFFAFSNGQGNFYSRNGALQIDGGGYLVSPNNGFALQGLMADAQGNIPSGAVPGNIKIPYGEKAPAAATSKVGFQSNLDKDSAGRGTIVHTGRFLTTASTNGGDLATSDRLNTLFDGSGNDLGIKHGDVLEFNVNSAGVSYKGEFPVVDNAGSMKGMEDLRRELESFLRGIPGMGGTDVVLNSDGQFDIVAPEGTVASSINIGNATRPTSDTFVKNLFNWTGGIRTRDYREYPEGHDNHVPYDPANPDTWYSNSSRGRVLSTAKSDTRMADVFDAAGNRLGLEDGDLIRINGSVGTTTLAEDDGWPYDPDNTMSDFMTQLQMRLNLPDEVMAADGNYVPTVQLNPAVDGDSNAPVGSIVIRGQSQTAFALNGLSISANNSNNNEISPAAFNSNSIVTQIQAARDTTVHSTSIEVFDQSGQAHTMTTTFIHTGVPNKWLWEISMEGNQEVLSGSRGTLEFGQDGSPSAWIFEDGTSQLRFDPKNGSDIVSIDLSVGGPGQFTGITQFRSATTTSAKDQNGYPMGMLDQISISETGEISGVYTNGVSKQIAKILVAEFNNPAGLMRLSDSMWTTSANSGDAVLHEAGKGSTSTIKPGSLEMSNVDLSTEFVDLITIQKAYQASARVITSADKLLTELVQLVR